MFAPAWPPLRPGGAALAGNNEIDLNSLTESSLIWTVRSDCPPNGC